MDYIYNGEVNILQDGLDRFLGVAQRLKLEGVDDIEILKDMEAETAHVVENTTKKQREVTKSDKVVVPISSEDVNVAIEVRNRTQQYIETDGYGNMRCTICGKEAIGGKKHTKWHLQSHIETHFEGLSFSCQLCGKTFRSSNSFKVHITRSHR